MTGFVLLIFGVLSAFAGEAVLIPAEKVSDFEYKVELKARPHFQSLTQAYLRSVPSSAKRERLLDVYTRAQQAFIARGGKVAISAFEAVFALRFEEDWSETEREILTIATLRLAQLQTEASEQEQWLRQALHFGDDVIVDASLFPPPLLRRWRELLNSTPRLPNPFDQVEADWSAILINGRLCEAENCSPPFAVPGRVRVTLLSNKHLPQTRLLDLSDLARIRPEKQPLLTGECGRDTFHSWTQRFAERVGFWGLACQSPAPKLDLTPAMPLPQELALPEKPVSRTPIYKSKWFWAGIGAAAITALVIANDRKKDADEPASTTYGY